MLRDGGECMEKYAKMIEQDIKNCKPNRIIIAARFYEKFRDVIPEQTYYKSLERLSRKDELIHLSKGIYYRPKKSRFGI